MAASDYHASRTKLIERQLASLLKLCNLAIDHTKRQARQAIYRPDFYAQARFTLRGHDAVFPRTAFYASGFGCSERGK